MRAVIDVNNMPALHIIAIFPVSIEGVERFKWDIINLIAEIIVSHCSADYPLLRGSLPVWACDFSFSIHAVNGVSGVDSACHFVLLFICSTWNICSQIICSQIMFHVEHRYWLQGHHDKNVVMFTKMS